MARAKGGFKTRRTRKKFIKMASGYRGRRKETFKAAYNAVVHALSYAFKHRRAKKREFRTLWIQRINAGAKESGLSYSKFMHGLKKAGISIDRKVLSDLILNNKEAFQVIVDKVKKELN